MSEHDLQLTARRSFLSRLGLGLSAFGAALSGSGSTAAAQSGEGSHWQPARHSLDDWFDQIPGKHRYVFDSSTPEGFGNGLAFLNNYFTVNQNAYGLQDSDLAVILVARHTSTLFAYKDAVWAKYGTQITQRTNFNDPKTKQPPTLNLFNADGYGAALPNRGNILDNLLKRGLRLAVCQLSTRGNAAAVAAATGGNAEAVYNELVSNLLPNARLVPAGIVAVNRAQEHGYSLATAG